METSAQASGFCFNDELLSRTEGNTSLALTGKAFNLIQELRDSQPVLYEAILAKTKVYARMSPDDKT